MEKLLTPVEDLTPAEMATTCRTIQYLLTPPRYYGSRRVEEILRVLSIAHAFYLAYNFEDEELAIENAINTAMSLFGVTKATLVAKLTRELDKNMAQVIALIKEALNSTDPLSDSLLHLILRHLTKYDNHQDVVDYYCGINFHKV